MNFLEGYQCPNCKSKGPFSITITFELTAYSSGVSWESGDMHRATLGDNNRCKCQDCKFRGQLKYFKKSYQDTPMWDLDDRRFVYNILLRCSKQNPLFSGDEILKLYKIAGKTTKKEIKDRSVYQMFEEVARELCDIAKEKYRDEIPGLMR